MTNVYASTHDIDLISQIYSTPTISKEVEEIRGGDPCNFGFLLLNINSVRKKFNDLHQFVSDSIDILK